MVASPLRSLVSTGRSSSPTSTHFSSPRNGNSDTGGMLPLVTPPSDSGIEVNPSLASQTIGCNLLSVNSKSVSIQRGTQSPPRPNDWQSLLSKHASSKALEQCGVALT